MVGAEEEADRRSLSKKTLIPNNIAMRWIASMKRLKW
jgi:hypothetical protein